MSDEFKMSTGQAHEFALACVRNGLTNADVKMLCESNMLAKVKLVVRGQVVVTFPSQILASNLLIPTGWEIIEDVAPTDFKISDLEMVPFLEGGESYINGEVLRQRAVGLKANLGLADAKYFLDHQAEIPVEFQSEYLVFTGTLLRDPDGNLLVAGLSWSGGRWELAFRSLVLVWRGYHRLLRCK